LVATYKQNTPLQVTENIEKLQTNRQKNPRETIRSFGGLGVACCL
jgi:hypothetical protein